MRDWITNPRSTGYESLHLTVLGPDKNGLKFKSVPKEWTKSLKKGVAAHYKYKEGFKQNSDDRNFEQWVSD